MAITPEQQSKIESLQKEIKKENDSLIELKKTKKELEEAIPKIKKMRENLGEAYELLWTAKEEVEDSKEDLCESYIGDKGKDILGEYTGIDEDINASMSVLKNMNSIGWNELNKVTNDLQVCERNISRHESSIGNKRAILRGLDRISEY